MRLGSFFAFCVVLQASLSLSSAEANFGEDNEPYLSWLEESDLGFTNSVYLPASDDAGAAIHWKFDGEYIYFGLAFRASGWAGFGLSDAGGMRGSDMVYFEVKSPSSLTDAHCIEENVPVPDTCHQDWELLDSKVSDGFIFFETRRLLDTGDPQDRPIVDDSNVVFPAHRVIAAWGDSDTIGFHGSNVVRGAVRFFNPASAVDSEKSFNAVMDAEAEGSFQLRAKNFSVPEEETVYASFCFSRDDLIDMGVPNVTGNFLNTIGFRPHIQPENIAYVHHYVLSASFAPYDENTDECEELFSSVAYVWAPGEGSFAFPNHLGSPLLGGRGYQSFKLEIHYDNPTLKTDIVDSSGVDLFYTSQAREFEVGVYEVGDPYVGLFDELVGEGLSRHSFDCPSNCSAFFLDEPVTVIREYLHMHQTGTRMINEQYRDNEIVRTATVDVWDFNQNGNVAVQQEEYQINPGDSFRTTCFFRPDSSTKFGLGSREEMCMAFLYYYPRKYFAVEYEEETYHLPYACALDADVDECEASHKTSPSLAESLLERRFGMVQCPASEPASPGGSSSASLMSSLSLSTVALALFMI